MRSHASLKQTFRARYLVLPICLVGFLIPQAGSAFLEGESVRPLPESGPAAGFFSAGHEALSRDNYFEAIEAFRAAQHSSVDSALVGEALYWEAFALYRQGGMEQLKAAAAALARLQQQYRASASGADAAELELRIQGLLARQGDAVAIARIAAKARELERRESSASAPAYSAALLAYEEAHAAQRVAQATMASTRNELEAARVAAEEQRRQAELLRLGAASDPALMLYGSFAAAEESAIDEDDIRIAALSALARMDEDRALPILRSVLARRDEGSEKLREKAIFVLAMHDSPAAGELILDAARHDPDVRVRSRAVYHLGLVSSEEALTVLEDILLGADDPEVLEHALNALSYRRPEQSAEIFRQVAMRSDLPLYARERAIEMLGLPGSDENLSFLLQFFEELDEPALTGAIVIAVGQYRDERSRNWLVGLVRNTEVPLSVREMAFSWAGHNPRVTTEQLVDLYDSLEGRGMRTQAVLVIGRRGGEAATDFILRVAQDEDDPEVRRAAIFWLGQSRDPRAAEYLEELIGQ